LRLWEWDIRIRLQRGEALSKARVGDAEAGQDFRGHVRFGEDREKEVLGSDPSVVQLLGLNNCVFMLTIDPQSRLSN
jgi:hypothetical protein